MAAITGQFGAFFGPANDSEGNIAPPSAFSQTAMTRQPDGETYIVDDPALRYWDKTKPMIVEQRVGSGDWEAVTTGFTVQHAGGVVVFKTADSTREVRVTGYAYDLEEKLGFFNWTLTIDVTMHEAANFQTEGWVEHVPGNRSWFAQTEQHWRSDEQLADWLGELLPVSFYVDDQPGRKLRYEGVGYINQDAVTTPQGDLVTRTMQFTGDGAVARRSG